MSKKIEEDSNRTVAEPVEVVHASRDEEPEIVETAEIVEPETTETDETDDVRGDIYKRHSQKRDKEIEEDTALPGQDTEIVVDNDGARDIIDDEDGASPVSATPSDVDEPMVNVTVYGDVHRVPQSRIDKMPGNDNDTKLQAYQKHLAVEKGLENNAHTARALEAREKAIAEREQRIKLEDAAVPAMDRQEGTPDRSTPLDDQNLEEQARRYQEAVYDNDEDAPSILAGMVATAVNSGDKFDPDTFRRQVKDEMLQEQRQSKIVKATTALISSHPELNERDPRFDPRTFTAVDDETTVVERQHPEFEPDEVVEEAYSRVQKWKGGHQTETMTDKQKEKQQRSRPRVGSQRYTPPPPPKRQTNSDYVASLRVTRGQGET